MTARRVPSFAEHVALLWAVRLRIGLNRGTAGGPLVPVLGFLASSAPSVGLGFFFYRLMQAPLVAESDTWSDFLVRILCFVTSAVWLTWPVLSAGVDDHSELSRYAAFPISALRLLVASTLATLAEPRALVFHGPAVGAALGYMAVRPPTSYALVLAAFLAWVLFNAAVSRVGLHLMLLVLRQPRSAELLGGGFVAFLLVASLIPPVDTSWLQRVGQLGVEAVPDDLLERAARGMGRFPTGWFAYALAASAQGRNDVALGCVMRLLELMMLAMTVAWGLLLQFHRLSGRGFAEGALREANPFARTASTFATLMVREALDLFHNPRARLLVSVPFVLAILLKLLSGRALFQFAAGEAADAWVLGGLCVYGAIVMGSTFSQNAFAYDGHGFAVFLAAPVALGDVLKAKNVVNVLFAAGLAVLVACFYVVYFGAGRPLDVAVALGAVAALLPVTLLAGNFLSLYFPVKFHANLRRRDKLPFAASMVGVAAASVGSWPLALALLRGGRQAPGWEAVGVVAAAAALGWGLYAATLPLAIRLLTARRELVLQAVTRE